jgi:hypothetical protein
MKAIAAAMPVSVRRGKWTNGSASGRPTVLVAPMIV